MKSYEQEARELGRRADVDLVLANQEKNEALARADAAEERLRKAELEVRRLRRQLRTSVAFQRKAEAEVRRLKQQPSVGENLLARSTAEAPVVPKRSRKIIEA
jgi:hypothetical protein